MKIINQENLIIKTREKLKKLQEETSIKCQVTCKCCEAEIEFEPNEMIPNGYVFDGSGFIRCPSCGAIINLETKYYKQLGKKLIHIRIYENIIENNSQ